MYYIAMTTVFLVIWFSSKISHKQECDNLTNELDRLKKQHNNTLNDNKNLIMAYQRHFGTSIDDLSLNSKICNPGGLAYVQKPYENRKLLQLPNNKFQIVILSEEGLVLSPTDLGVVDTLEEVKAHMKSASYIILN